MGIKKGENASLDIALLYSATIQNRVAEVFTYLMLSIFFVLVFILHENRGLYVGVDPFLVGIPLFAAIAMSLGMVGYTWITQNDHNATVASLPADLAHLSGALMRHWMKHCDRLVVDVAVLLYLVFFLGHMSDLPKYQWSRDVSDAWMYAGFPAGFFICRTIRKFGILLVRPDEHALSS